MARSYNPDDIVSVKAVWARLFPGTAYPEAIEIGLHSSPGYLVEDGELFAMGWIQVAVIKNPDQLRLEERFEYEEDLLDVVCQQNQPELQSDMKQQVKNLNKNVLKLKKAVAPHISIYYQSHVTARLAVNE